MNTLLITNMAKKYFSEKEALDFIFSKIKPSIIGTKNYNKFASYRQRHEKGELGEGAKMVLLEFFGFMPSSFTYDKERDNSLKSGK